MISAWLLLPLEPLGPLWTPFCFHFGVILEWEDWESLKEKIKKIDYPFLVEPKIRFKSKPGEQGTFFISDPSGNALEFKTFKHDSMVFEKFE